MSERANTFNRMAGGWLVPTCGLLAGCHAGGSAGGPAEPAAQDASAPELGALVDQPPPESASRVTFADEGGAFDPALTPDGSRVVFASTQHRETADLYIKSIDSRVITRLTTDPAEDAMPAVSPDGATLAFASNRSGNWDIYTMPIGGGQAVQVTSDPADELHPSWAPDGDRIAFSRLGPNNGRWEMWVTSAKNAAVSHYIGPGLFPCWCPVAGTGADGADRLLFQLGRERGDRAYAVWVLDYKDGRTANVTEIAGSSGWAFVNPAWSTDGSRIVFAATATGSTLPAGSSELRMVNADGTQPVILARSVRRGGAPVCGPDGRVYFVCEQGGFENVWTIDSGAPSPARTADAAPADAAAEPHH